MKEYSDVLAVPLDVDESVITFIPKNSIKGKGGYGDLPNLRLCPHAEEIKTLGRMVEVKFMSELSRKRYCGHWNTTGGLVPCSACVVLRDILRARIATLKSEIDALEGRQADEARDLSRKSAEAEAARKMEEMSATEALHNFWSLSLAEQRQFLNRQVSPMKKSRAKAPKASTAGLHSIKEIKKRAWDLDSKLFIFEQNVSGSDTVLQSPCPLVQRLVT